MTITVGPKKADLVGSTERVLQAAVDYISRFGGGTVKVLPGNYTLRNSIYLRSGIRILGSGADSVLTKGPSHSVALADDSDWYDQEVTVADAKGFNVGDGILFSDSPFLGRSTAYNVIVSAKPTTRLSTRIRAISSRFVNPVGNAELFDVKIFRTETTYQFTERFLLRHIMEHNTLSMTLGNNLLLTYRINAGTVAFLGYDDRFQRGTRINDTLFLTTALQRTNRAVFAKLSYLFRH